MSMDGYIDVGATCTTLNQGQGEPKVTYGFKDQYIILKIYLHQIPQVQLDIYQHVFPKIMYTT